ncbi:MAG: hypothetical protein ABFS30_15360 [Pseudomonadota bacterium]
MQTDANQVGGQVKRLCLKKFDGEATPGKRPVETVEIEYDEAGRLKYRTVTKHAGESHGAD